MFIQFQPSCCVQGYQPQDQAAQGHIQPGLECLQGWGIHNLLGQPVQYLRDTVRVGGPSWRTQFKEKSKICSLLLFFSVTFCLFICFPPLNEISFPNFFQKKKKQQEERLSADFWKEYVVIDNVCLFFIPVVYIVGNICIAENDPVITHSNSSYSTTWLLHGHTVPKYMEEAEMNLRSPL